MQKLIIGGVTALVALILLCGYLIFHVQAELNNQMQPDKTAQITKPDPSEDKKDPDTGSDSSSESDQSDKEEDSKKDEVPEQKSDTQETESDKSSPVQDSSTSSKSEKAVNTAINSIPIPKYFETLEKYGISEDHIKFESGKWQYLVQKNDSLDKLAKAFSTTVQFLQQENKIQDPSMIRGGTYIIIPSE